MDREELHELYREIDRVGRRETRKANIRFYWRLLTFRPICRCCGLPVITRIPPDRQHKISCVVSKNPECYDTLGRWKR